MPGIFKKIYVVYPRGVRTGGPEALHQLVSTLRGLGEEAYLVPRPGTEGAERVPDYQRYDAPEVSSIEDGPANAVVASEYVMGLLSSVRRATRFCWWLSIDNSPVFRYQRKALGLWESPREKMVQTAKYRALSRLRAARHLVDGERTLLRGINHLAQSQYAWSHLYSTFNILATKVSDYTPLGVVESAEQLPVGCRGRTVAFNPKKAAAITERLMKSFPAAEFTPLVGMTSSEVAQALASSAVYLDLGYHPGKDRMPREAAMCGSVSLVARRGSGAFHADVPIPWEQKISPNGDVVKSARAAIERVFDDPMTSWANQSAYRDQIAKEQQTFVQEVKDAFVEGKFESDVV